MIQRAVINKKTKKIVYTEAPLPFDPGNGIINASKLHGFNPKDLEEITIDEKKLKKEMEKQSEDKNKSRKEFAELKKFLKDANLVSISSSKKTDLLLRFEQLKIQIRDKDF